MKNFFFLSALALSSLIYSQKADCSATITELANVKVQNIELQKQNDYYKETLHLLNPIKTANADGLKIDITKAVANRKEKRLVLTAIYTVTDGKVRAIAGTDKINFVDPQGNQYSSYVTRMGPSDLWAKDVQPNIPMKMTADFSIPEAEFPMIRQLTWYLLSNENFYNKIPISFENIPVIWE